MGIRNKVFILLSGIFLLASNGCTPNTGEVNNISDHEHKLTDIVASISPEPSKTPDDNITSDPEPTPTISTENNTPKDDQTKEPSVFEVEGNQFTPVNDTIKVIASKCNIRTSPSTSSSVVLTAKAGDKFTRTGIGNGAWDQLVYQGETVYVWNEFIQKVEGSEKAINEAGNTEIANGNEPENNENASGNKPENNEIANGNNKDSEGNANINSNLEPKELTIVDSSKNEYSYDDLRTDLGQLTALYPDRMQLNTLSTTRDGRYVYEVIIGDPNAEKHVMILASLHAREYMTSLLVMKQMEYYLYYEDTGVYENATYQELFDNVAFHILPMVNPDGVTISQTGLDGIRGVTTKKEIREWYDRDYAAKITNLSFLDYLSQYKANANGVDLNRNFSYGWDTFSGAKDKGSEEFKGLSPESEPEVLAITALTENLKPVATIHYHAAGSVLFWDYKQTGDIGRQCIELVNLINQVTGYEIGKATGNEQEVASYGGWCVMTMEIPSVTIEIGDTPIDISDFSAIWEKNKNVWLALAAKYR